MIALQLLLIGLVLVGHMAVWTALFNRLHALPISCGLNQRLELPHGLITIAYPAWLLWQLWNHPEALTDAMSFFSARPLVGGYGAICSAYAIWVAGRWTYRKLFSRQPGQLLSNDTELFDIAAQLGSRPMSGWTTRLFSRFPGNQIFHLSVDEKELELSRLPPELDGLTITHFSDLHFCGKITRPYFDRVMDRANAFNSDLIAITGDILEYEPYYPWLPETLGRLRAPHGIYFVLGNHDQRLPNVEKLRRSLCDLGLVDLGQAPRLISIREQQILLAGNELPWFGPPPELSKPPGEPAIRILLSHSPDQIGWAKQRRIDLLLAGHTHGGHIRLPLIGPVVCPSRYGVKYASGVFYEHPTLMHVSRGISGVDPLRLNCPPELTKLVLRRCGTPDRKG